MKNIYFFEFSNLTPHLETSLELVKSHLNKGDKVFYFFLGHDTPYKEGVFPISFSSKILGSLLPERKGAALLKHPNFNFIPSSTLPKSIYNLPAINNIEELKLIKYKNWDLGMAVASSLISLTKNSEPQIKKYEKLISKMVASTVSVFEFVVELLSRSNADLVYIFNGRFCNQRAVLRACEFLHVPYLIQERGANKDLYFLRPFMPHDKNSIQDEMRSLWNSLSNLEEAKKISNDWFLSRRSGVDTDWYSYSKFQQKNLLPNLDHSKKIVTYFHSSDDEYAAIGDQFLWNGWKDQYDAVVQLIKLASTMDNIQLVIRLHPHLAKKSKEDNIKWGNLTTLTNKVIVIDPKSKVDSYGLIDNSNLVISSGSKAGIESVFYGKPSILLGPSPYDNLDVTYTAHDVVKLRQLINSQDLPIKNPDNLLMYGYWWATHGDKFLYYDAKSLSQGLFMGKDLQKKPVILSYLLNLKRNIFKSN